MAFSRISPEFSFRQEAPLGARGLGTFRSQSHFSLHPRASWWSPISTAWCSPLEALGRSSARLSKRLNPSSLRSASKTYLTLEESSATLRFEDPELGTSHDLPPRSDYTCTTFGMTVSYTSTGPETRTASHRQYGAKSASNGHKLDIATVECESLMPFPCGVKLRR